MKECNTCYQLKNLNEFYKHPKSKDGYNACCKECQKTYNKGYNKNKRKSHYCPNCGNKIPYYLKYCSSECLTTYKWEERKKIIEQTGKITIDDITNDTYSRKIAKQYLIEKYGNKCMMCGLEEWLGQPIVLICDHIDGDASNCNIGNFRIICSNCNSTLSTFTGRNRGNGRKSKGLKNH